MAIFILVSLSNFFLLCNLEIVSLFYKQTVALEIYFCFMKVNLPEIL